jgi:hypothetical protein
VWLIRSRDSFYFYSVSTRQLLSCLRVPTVSSAVFIYVLYPVFHIFGVRNRTLAIAASAWPCFVRPRRHDSVTKSGTL